MSDTNWDLFRLFSVVARIGSVNRAASELGMSQPTLSRRLKELEQYIGAPLFFRASSGVKLTQEGDDLWRSAGSMLATFEAFHRDMRSQVGQRSSVVKISASEGLTKHWLFPRVAKIQKINSRLSLEITSTLHQQSIATNDLDFVIRMGDPGENDLIGKKVATAAFGIFASERYLASRKPLRSLDDLQDHEIIGYTADFSGFQSERAGELPLFTHFSAAAAKRSVLRTTPVANHFSAAAQDLGLAFLAVPFALAEGLIRVLPQERALLNVWLLRRRESDLRKLTKEVRRFLEAEFIKSQEWLAGEAHSRKGSRRKP